MDQWNLRTAAAHISQYTQQSAQGGSAQYSYNSNTYGNNQQQQQPQQQQQQQQQQPSSAASAAYNPQAYLQQTVGYGGGSTYAGGQQQIWSQRPQADQTQTGYGGGNRVTASQVPSTGVTSGNQYAGQYGGVYGVPQQQQQQPQQLMGVGSKAADYQNSGAVSRSSSAYGSGGGGVQDRPVASGASYVAGGVSSVYGAADSGKYLPNPGYVAKGVDYASANQYNNQKTSADQYMSAASNYVKPDNYASQVYEQLQQVARAAATGSQDMSARGVLGNAGYGTSTADAASGLLATLGGAGGLSGGSLSAQQNNAYVGGNRGPMTSAQVYPASPTLGYGGVSLPPGRDYGTGRVSTGGSMFQREGSYGRDRPSIGSSRFDDRERERERKREEREREREKERERDREREREQREIERRERERERERREEERRRERTPPPRIRREPSPPVRRDDKSKRESPRREPRHASPSKDKRREYICKIDPSNLLEAERDYNSITRRYTRLTVVPEFTKYIVSWLGMEEKIPLENSVSFEHDSADVEDEPESKETAPKSIDKQKAPIAWHVKVMLMSGLTEDCVGELLSDKVTEKVTNMHKMLKFVALRRDRNAIMAAGGRWDKSLDGGDPAVDDNALIRTAVRCLKELVQLDLSECKTWIRFGEIHYDRVDSDGLPSHKEISVLLLPDLSCCIPSVENWCLQWNQRKQAKLDRETTAKKETTPIEKDGEKESANGVENPEETAAKDEKKDKDDKKEEDKKEEAPPEPGFVLISKRSKTSKLRSMTISLDGLLDYDENDKDECTFELSLFAEAFAEMLQFKKGNQILSSLEALRKASHIRKKEDKKRIRQAEPGKEQDTKRAKSEGVKPPSDETPKPTSSVPMDDPQEEQKAEKEGGEPDPKPSATPTPEAEQPEEKDEGVKKEKNGGSKKEKEKKEKSVVVDKELLKAYRYFDRNKTGYIKAEDLKKLLHSLGKFLSSKHVKDLVNCAVLESGKLRDDRIVYRNLTDREISL